MLWVTVSVMVLTVAFNNMFVGFTTTYVISAYQDEVYNIMW
jgi:hypothetical protein